MKKPLLILSLFLFFLSFSCKKEESSHPIVGTWVARFKIIDRVGPIYYFMNHKIDQPEKSVFGDHMLKLDFRENGHGEISIQSYPVCHDENGNLVTITSNELIYENPYLCGGIGFSQEYFVNEVHDFIWYTQKDTLELNFNPNVLCEEEPLINNIFFISGRSSECFSCTFKIEEENLIITTKSRTLSGIEENTITYTRE